MPVTNEPTKLECHFGEPASEISAPWAEPPGASAETSPIVRERATRGQSTGRTIHSAMNLLPVLAILASVCYIAYSTGLLFVIDEAFGLSMRPSTTRPSLSEPIHRRDRFEPPVLSFPKIEKPSCQIALLASGLQATAAQENPCTTG